MASSRLLYTKDGRAYYQIRVSNGRVKTQSSMSWFVPDGWSKRAVERELRKVEADFESKVRRGEVLTRKEKQAAEEQRQLEEMKIFTVKQYGEKVFMPALAVHASENSRSSYQSNLDNHVYPYFGDIKITDITTAMITARLLEFQANNHKHASCVKLYTVLSGLFKKAKKEHVISVNPMDDVDRPKPAKKEIIKTEPEAYTSAELAKIYKCVDKEPLMWQVYIYIMAETGCRRGELTGLQWKNIDFNNGKILVCETFNYTPKAGEYVDTPKNRKVRYLYISDWVIGLLKQWKQLQSELQSEHEELKEPCGSVFIRSRNPYKQMSAQTPTSHFEGMSIRYGIDNFHPHKLRHTFASIALTNGADVKSLSEYIGHADAGFTLKTYAHASEESLKKTTEIFRNVMQNELADKKEDKNKIHT